MIVALLLEAARESPYGVGEPVHESPCHHITSLEAEKSPLSFFDSNTVPAIFIKKYS